MIRLSRVLCFYFGKEHKIVFEIAYTSFHFSRKNPFGLYVLLNENGDATGELYWDDGDSYC